MSDKSIEATSGQDGLSEPQQPERFSPREELLALVDECIAAATDDREQKALYATREELIAAMDEIKR